MPVTLTAVLSCGGCPASVTLEPWLWRSEFVSLSGRDHGLGRQVPHEVEIPLPDGWVPFDPYTGCTYCPACWTSINATVEEARADASGSAARRP